MSFPLKPNPGCTMPTPKGMPDISSFLNKLTVDAAKKLLSTPPSKATQALAFAEKVKKEKKALDNLVTKRTAQVKKLASLKCPCAKVPDKAANPNA